MMVRHIIDTISTWVMSRISLDDPDVVRMVVEEFAARREAQESRQRQQELNIIEADLLARLQRQGIRRD